MSAGAVLRAPSVMALRRMWTDLDDCFRAAQQGAALLVRGGSVLPLTSFCGVTVFPVVAWDAEATSFRTRHGFPPAATIEGARVLIDAGVPSALRTIAFIGVGPPTPMRRSLRPLRSLAWTIGLLPRLPRAPMLAHEFDLQGSALVVAEGDHVVVKVRGDGGPLPSANLSESWRRIYEESLYAWALEA